MDINHSHLKYWLALDKFPKFGQVRLSRLNDYFKSPQDAFEANLPELISAKIEESVAHEFIKFRSTLNLNQLVDQLIYEDIGVLTLNDEDYPVLLKQIYNPPFLIYYKGNLKQANHSLAVVGTRKFSPYGRRAVEELIPLIAKSGITITSGLALGIDALAHSNTLNAGGHTVAVLGSGIDKRSVYPASNRALAERILANNGAILSEYPLGTEPFKYNFPMRNRIISGLSFGTLVIEAAVASGSLITARTALEQNREVFAVPGGIFSPMSEGTNSLIAQGAIPVTSAEQILATLDLSTLNSYSNNRYIGENDDECLILSFLSKEPVHFEELIIKTQFPTSQLNSLLTILEIKKAIRNLGGLNYIVN
jgi:DNA processing protein